MIVERHAARLDPSRHAATAEMLARAFWDDPLSVFVFTDEAQRGRQLQWFFRLVARYVLRYGEAYAPQAAVEGAALWLPPGDATVSPLRIARMEMVLAPFKLGLASVGRFMSVMNQLEHLHKRDVPADHWYLFVLGVDPPRQGQGLGGRLIQPVLERADADRLPCYLETMKERNLAFYRNHGFEVVVEGKIPKGGPSYWTMKREPIG